MLACIACAKQDADEEGEDGPRAATTPSNKETVKSLTSQIKDMVLKFSGSSRQIKGGGSTSSSSSSFRSRSFRHRHSGRQEHGAYTYEDLAYCSNQSRAGHATARPAAWDSTKSMKEEQRRCGGKWSGGIEEDIVVEDDIGEPKEWIAQVEPGVHITFVSLPGEAGNELKRIRFSQEMFNKWQAQRWWGENYDRIMELYNVRRYNTQALQTPARSDDGKRESTWSRVGSTRESPINQAPFATEQLTARDMHKPPPPTDLTASRILPHRLHSPAAAASAAETETAPGSSGAKEEATASVDASRTTTSSRDERSVSVSNTSDVLEITEWVEEDEPGVYITICEHADGIRELRRVRFSRDKFGDVDAKLWWEANRERIQTQYLQDVELNASQLSVHSNRVTMS
ncbi:protein Brevis radix-like 1 [Zingiber officinale]|uniref:protein Brevis radix-like 1 n=1 Tax=Zingiber officinale TaxID=94328 RepID=UPI001C4CA71B|nr:protein Brevis radix-like 1 [Zingiber officinale]XP_042422660.1 protein Brevis radix-like 1 [Zingiber officinale]